MKKTMLTVFITLSTASLAEIASAQVGGPLTVPEGDSLLLLALAFGVLAIAYSVWRKKLG